MCSIEEAWAGQLFENRRVQSQADLHRKYMPITDNLLERNNEFSVGRNEPQSREGTRGMNTQQIPQRNYSSGKNDMQVNFETNRPEMSYYGGLNPRPSYMSIYDNAGESNIPMPSMTTIGGKDNFNDINQAFTVSKTVDRFMNQAQNNMNNDMNNDANNDVNMLLNEDNDMDRQILQKKFQNKQAEEFNSNTTSQLSIDQVVNFQKTLQDVLLRLDRLEAKMQNQQIRNMYDMVLYILVGMLIAFILYSILRK